MNKSIERQIQQIYDLVFNQVYNMSTTSSLANGSRIDVLRKVSKIEASKKYNDFAKQFAKELAKKGLRSQRGIWRKFYEAAKRAHYIALPVSYSTYEATLMSKAVKHNFEMIKSIPRRTVEIMEHKYTATLIEEVAKGALSRGSFRKQLEVHGHKNAKLIARTETAKLQTAIVETRARDLGSIGYIWLSSNDRRTRPSHKSMNGVIVFWRDSSFEKPLLDKMTGNAGEFPNCRCSPQPIVDADDLTQSKYKVYNYHTHKIIIMTKTEVLNSLQEGFLK